MIKVVFILIFLASVIGIIFALCSVQNTIKKNIDLGEKIKRQHHRMKKIRDEVEKWRGY